MGWKGLKAFLEIDQRTYFQSTCTTLSMLRTSVEQKRLLISTSHFFALVSSRDVNEVLFRGGSDGYFIQICLRNTAVHFFAVVYGMIFSWYLRIFKSFALVKSVLHF